MPTCKKIIILAALGASVSVLAAPKLAASDNAPLLYSEFSKTEKMIFGTSPEVKDAPQQLAKLPPEPMQEPRKHTPKVKSQDLKGWDHLYSLLIDKGADPVMLSRVLTDSRMPEREPLYFSIEPKEPRALYRKHNTARARRNALRFYRSHYRYFKTASLRFGVPDSVILSILQVETQCGAYTGTSRVFHRLARLASAAAPENIKANVKLQKSKKQKQHQLDERIAKRAEWLQDEFAPHAVATLKLAQSMEIHPLELKGSPAGAIGIPQFLPGNVARYGMDGDNDGIVDLFNGADAVHSVSNYLLQNGWKKGETLSLKQKRKVIWSYNRSTHYITTVLSMASLLERDVARVGSELEKAFQEIAALDSSK